VSHSSQNRSLRTCSSQTVSCLILILKQLNLMRQMQTFIRNTHKGAFVLLKSRLHIFFTEFECRRGPHLIHDSLSPYEPTTQTEYRLVQPFLHSSPQRVLLLQSVPILYNIIGRPFSPQNCPFPWGYEPHLTHGSLGPPEFSTQTEFRSVEPFFAGLTTVTDRQTTLLGR